MAGTLADTGAQYALEALFVQADQSLESEVTIHLFTNDFTPTDSTTEGDLTEATGGGYSSKTVDVEQSFIDSVAITSSSAASPTNILSATHGLTTGDYITIRNHSGSASNINGTHQVTVVDTTNFTIPVNLSSGGGTGGTLSRGFQSSSSGGIRQVACNPIPFYFTGAMTSTATAYGIYIKTAGGDFIGAARFGTTYTPTTTGDIVNVSLIIKLSYGTAQ